ncbi:hypothetical protein RHSIM_Rhsim01G0267300 [Rhododendron simsii]|uniref:Uncharacterized protein n=1 Tax=Rhododendron simsii TaxID=118357 RepID=A0A834M0Y7_RHOSS|nr:hypothetical protein RHSIM_Rhsim01G0267300 [Rhododendron simsii]
MRTTNVALAILAILFLLTIFKPHEAARILDDDEEELMKSESLLLLSLALQRVPVTPSHPSPDTHISASTLGQKGFAGQAMLLEPPVYPHHTVQFASKMRTINVALAILALLFLLTIFKPHEAARILHEQEEELMKCESLLLQSLAHTPVDPSHPSPDTHIPASTLGQKGFALQGTPVTPSHPSPDTHIPASTLGQKGFALQGTPVTPSHPSPDTHIPASTLGQKGFAVQRTPVTPSHPSPPTHIPASTLGQKGFAVQRTPVTPSQQSPDTYIPASTLGQKGFAGQAMPLAPPVYPRHTVQFVNKQYSMKDVYSIKIKVSIEEEKLNSSITWLKVKTIGIADCVHKEKRLVKEEQRLKGAHAQRTFHGLQPTETNMMFADRSDFAYLSQMAEEAEI